MGVVSQIRLEIRLEISEIDWVGFTGRNSLFRVGILTDRVLTRALPILIDFATLIRLDTRRVGF